VKAREIRPGIEWMGAIDWDRRLFDELIPLPDGTSYNAYLVRGSEKKALIDTADPAKSDALITQLAEVDKIDYLIIQHVEQDHSGSACGAGSFRIRAVDPGEVSGCTNLFQPQGQDYDRRSSRNFRRQDHCS